MPRITSVIRLSCAVALSLALAAAQNPAPRLKISAAELKGDLSFLASDTLQGRYTPSPGLEVAAEFIASKFRAAGLEPGGNHDYFQTADMVDRRFPPITADLTIKGGSVSVTVPHSALIIMRAGQAKQLDATPVLLVDRRKAVSLDADLKGKVVIVRQKDPAKLSGEERSAERRAAMVLDRQISAAGAAVEISVVNYKPMDFGPRLLFPEQAEAATPLVAVHSEELDKLFDNAGETALLASMAIPAAEDTKVTVKNVVGILRGADPTLASTCVLLTAHYDHVGTTETAGHMAMSPAKKDSGDHIYNGANDDGSGTVSVIEIAQTLAKITPRPKRSIVFMTFFGEERGELGSQFYGKHPVFPLAKTVADVNLEQMGRTDSTNGPELNNVSVTGFDYSSVTGFFERAGKLMGVKVYKDDTASDAYFTRSDNDALAEQGVPAHTFCVAFDYPDYHAVGDEWQKIDYENMAKVDSMIAAGLLDIANSEKPPEWNAKNPKTAPFREAWEKLRSH